MRRPALLRIATILIGAALVSLGGGCRLLSNLNPLPKSDPKMTEQELLQSLRSFVIRTVRVAEATADRTLQERSTRHDRFVLLNWKITLDREFRRILDYRKPPHALIEMWVQSQRFINFSTTAECQAVFGVHSEALATFYESSAKGLEHLAEDVFDAKQMEATRTSVVAFAKKHPLKLSEVQSADSTKGFSLTESRTLANVVGNPTKIISYAVGVDDTARAIHTVTAAADRIAFMTAGIPQSSRWEMERLLFALDDNETTKSIVGDVHKLTDTVGTLPATLEDAVDRTLEKIDTKQANLRETIRQADEAMAEASSTLQEFERSAKALEAAATAIQPIMLEISKLAGVDDASRAAAAAAGPVPEDRTAVEKRPYDILDYAKTAEAATRTASELRELLAEIKQLAGGDDLPLAVDTLARKVDATTTKTRREAEDLSDHLFWRGVQIILVLLAAALAYRWLAPRIRSNQAPVTPAGQGGPGTG